MDTFKNGPKWYDMMIWYDMIMRYVMEYDMKYDMRYDVIWDHMMWHMSDMEWYDVIHCWEKGEIGWHNHYLTIFVHSVCCVWCVASVCLCVWWWLGGWVGVGCLRRCMVTLGPLIFSQVPPPGGCLNNPISYSGKYAACWAYFMRHHGLRPTAVSHPFSSLHIS